jgi:hypothetical protein
LKKLYRLALGYYHHQVHLGSSKAINAFSAQAWFYQQIKKMSSGKMPDLALKPFKAFRNDAKEDQTAILEYKKN